MGIANYIGQTLITRCLTFILVIGNSIIIARALGPHGKGVYTLYILIANMTMLVVDFGLGDSVVFLANNRKYQIQAILFTSIISVLLFSLIGVIMVIAICILSIFSEIDVHNKLIFFSLIALIPLMCLKKHFTDLMRSQNQFNIINSISILEQISFIIVLVALFIPHKISLSYVIVTYFINTVLFFLINSYIVIAKTPIIYKFNPSYALEAIRYGGKIYIGNIFRTLNFRIDSLIIGFFFASTAVGYYSIAASFAQLPNLLAFSIVSVILPKISALDAISSKNIIQPLIRGTVLITSVACCLLYLLGQWLIVLLYGQDFLPSTAPLYFLLPSAIFSNLAIILSNYFVGVGRAAISSYSAVVLFVSTLFLAVLLMPILNINGAALAVTLSSLLQISYLFWIMKKYYSFNLYNLIFINRNDIVYLLKFIKVR